MSNFSLFRYEFQRKMNPLDYNSKASSYEYMADELAWPFCNPLKRKTFKVAWFHAYYSLVSETGAHVFFMVSSHMFSSSDSIKIPKKSFDFKYILRFLPFRGEQKSIFFVRFKMTFPTNIMNTFQLKYITTVTQTLVNSIGRKDALFVIQFNIGVKWMHKLRGKWKWSW